MKPSGWLPVVLLVLAPGLADAQVVGGRVVEDSTTVAIPGAIVSVIRPGGALVGTARSDSIGGFSVNLDSAGIIQVRVTHPSFLTVLSDTVSVDENEAVTLELRLARLVIPIAPLVVTARTDRRLQAYRERLAKQYAFGHFITREQINRRPGVSTSELLRGVSGVRLVEAPPCQGCVAENLIYLRGGADRCLATILIDGMEVKQGVGMPIDATLLPDQLEGVEIYVDPAGVPPALGMFTNQCGVVAFWLKELEPGKHSWKKFAIGVGLFVGLILLFR